MDRRLRAVALAFSFLLVFVAFANAQQRGPVVTTDQDRGYQAGYRDGFPRGQQDAARGAKPNYRGASGRAVGNEYRRAYNEGYRVGYDAGYREGGARGRRPVTPLPGSGPNNRGPGSVERGGAYGGGSIAQLARENGHSEGRIKGQNDARQRKSYDPGRHDAYKDADQGYHDAYGSKSVYKQAYREGFLEGYRQGYGNRRF
jgi:hypothetical protein